MSAKIARGSGRSSTPRNGAGTRRAPARKAQPKGVLESFGIAPDVAQRVIGWSFLAILLIAAVAAIFAFRVPQLIGTAVGEGVGEGGFAVKRVDIRGLQRMDRLPVYAVALDQQSMAMPLVDLEGTRARLLQFGWIKEARVSRRLPDTLVVDIVERQPAAIWQNQGRLSLIDGEGVVLEPVRLDAMPDLPLVIGPGANRNVPILAGLLEAAPHLKPQVAGAAWVGSRRWDLRFQTGEVLALPEGDEAARRAILNFARMDQQTQLLGRGFARFDMRIPGRFIVRVTRQPGRSVPAELAPEAGTPPAGAPANPQDLARTI